MNAIKIVYHLYSVGRGGKERNAKISHSFQKLLGPRGGLGSDSNIEFFSLFLCYPERVDRVGYTNPAKAASKTMGGVYQYLSPKFQ